MLNQGWLKLYPRRRYGKTLNPGFTALILYRFSESKAKMPMISSAHLRPSGVDED
jgi:hypothetical protein